MMGRLEYDSLTVQPGQYTAGELEWDYNFEITINVDTSLLRSYVLFISFTLDSTSRNFPKASGFRESFNKSLIEAGVPYSFEENAEEHRIEISYEVVRDMIREYREVTEDASLLQAGGAFVETLSNIYKTEVGFDPDERIPGPIVPSKSSALCPVCESPLHIRLSDDKEYGEMHCESCDELRANPESWMWESPDPAPDYDGERPDEQPEIDAAACPNCGGLLSDVQDGVVGSCLECHGIWHKGTWHQYEHIPREEAACPKCGSKYPDTPDGNTAFCPTCDEVQKRRKWVEYDPLREMAEYPFEVEPGVIQLGKRKYRVKQTGHIVDSRWEADIDQRLAEQVPEHQREPEQFKIDNGYYWPDFRIGDIIIEVKGIQHEDMLDSAVYKSKSFRERNPELTYVVIGDEDSKEIPCDEWFKYPSDRFEAVEWVREQVKESDKYES